MWAPHARAWSAHERIYPVQRARRAPRQSLRYQLLRSTLTLTLRPTGRVSSASRCVCAPTARWTRCHASRGSTHQLATARGTRRDALLRVQRAGTRSGASEQATRRNAFRRVGRAFRSAPERVAARRVCGGAGRSAGWGGNRRGGGEHRGWGILKTRARYGDGVVYTTEHFCTVLFTALHLCTVDVCGTGRLQGGCEARTSPELLPRRSCRLES